MINTLVNLMLAISLVCLLIRCSNSHGDIVLDNIENIIEQYPDSALTLLSRIPNTDQFSKNDINRYNLLLIEAKDKCYEDITSDTIIVRVRDYYISTNNLKYIVLASYYSGRVLQEKNQTGRAINAYLEALNYARNISNNNLKGLILSNLSIVYGQKKLYDEAIKTAKESVNCFKESNNIKNEINSFVLIGNHFMLKNELDSAFIYYRKGTELSEINGLISQKVMIMQNIAIVYRNVGQYDKAKDLLNKIIEISKANDNSRIYLSMANTFIAESRYDSATIYANLALNTNDSLTKRSAYFVLSNIKEQQGNFKGALAEYKNYTKLITKIIEDEKDKTIMELSDKNQYIDLKNRHSELIIQNHKTILISMVIVIIACFFSLFYYIKFTKKKKYIEEADEKIESLKNMAHNYSEDQSFKNILLHHFDILKKAFFIDQYINEDDRKKGERIIKKFNEIVYGQNTLNWDMLYETMNKLRNGYYQKIKDKYPELDESEFRICCLTCESFSSTEISIIMNLTSNTVNKKKSIARKKIGVLPYGDILAFFNEQIS